MYDPYHTPRDTTEAPSLFRFVGRLSPFERLLGVILLVAVVSTGLLLLAKLHAGTLVGIPRSGGTLHESAVGSPRFINPLLAVSDADKDLSVLIYAGLMGRGADGSLEPALAESFSVSEDKTVYTFTLRADATFHDGMPVRADDVVYTISQVQNPDIKSARFANWDGVLVEKVDDRTVRFTLPAPFAPFLDNTTLGILPLHLWESTTAEEFTFSRYNTEPVGAGPYKIDSIKLDKQGIPSSYTLTHFTDYVRGRPHIEEIIFSLFRNETDRIAAFEDGQIDTLYGVDPATVASLAENPKRTIQTYTAPLQRIFAVFLNHNRAEFFLRDEVREALNVTLPREDIVRTILSGFGHPIDSPFPHGVLHASSTIPTATIAEAREILEGGGWETDEEGVYVRETDDATTRLAFSLSVPNAPAVLDAAERIREEWVALGADVELKVFEPTDLTQNIIRPRRYEALLFGEILGPERDLYAFWHSSQRNDPGLNIAQYANIEADKLLEDARAELDPDARQELFLKLDELIREDHPALFLYTPDFIYLLPDTVQNVTLASVTEPHDRFNTIHTWYIETDNVWPFVATFLNR